MSTITIPKILANFETSLAATMSAAATSLTLNASVDGDGTTLSGLYSLTFDEGTASEEHMLVTMTGASGAVSRRGLSRVDAYTEVTANKHVHNRGASVKVTNVSAVNIQRLLNGDDTFNAVNWLGVNSITGLATPTSGETTKAANVAFVNAVAIAGGVDATTSVKGLVKMSTAPVSATSPIAVGDNDTRVPTTGQTALLAAITADAAEINKLDGLTATQANLNEAGTFFGATDITGAEAETLTAGTSSDASQLHKHASSFKILTYDMATASGTTATAHGLGVAPKVVKITSYSAIGVGVKSWSVGTYDGTTTQSNTIDLSHTTAETSASYAVKVGRLDSANYQTATVAVDATNVTLTWTKTGTPTGNAYLLIESLA